jgi:hypothetical protein
MNTENIHKYLQQQTQAKLIAKNHQNIGTCLKFLHMHKILALAQNVGRLSKYRQQMYAENVCGKYMQQMYAANVGGKHRQQNIGGKCWRPNCAEL